MVGDIPEMEEIQAVNLILFVLLDTLSCFCLADQITCEQMVIVCSANDTTIVSKYSDTDMLCGSMHIMAVTQTSKSCSPIYSKTKDPCLTCCFAINPQPFEPRCFTLHATLGLGIGKLRAGDEGLKLPTKKLTR